jgi:thiol-disulfide isomerase/thioredoxin
MVMVVAVLALLLSAAAFLLSLGTTLRVQQLPTSQPGTDDSLQAGAPVPSDALAAVVRASRLQDLMRGPTAIMFVSSGCKPCQQMVTDFNDSPMDVKGASVLMVEPAGMQSLQPQARFDAEWISDEDGRLRKAFGTRATPHTFLVRDGHVVASQVGGNPAAAIQAALV